MTVDFQHRWEGVREPLIAQQVEGFAALQPNIKINNQNVFCSGSAEGCYGGMPYDKIYAQIAAGTPPDAFMVQSDYASDFSGKGALRNVSDLARRDKIDLPKTYYPALVQMATYKGSVNGLPQLSAGDSPYLYLSKEVAESAGVDVSKPPASWDDLVSCGPEDDQAGRRRGRLRAHRLRLP